MHRCVYDDISWSFDGGHIFIGGEGGFSRYLVEGTDSFNNPKTVRVL